MAEDISRDRRMPVAKAVSTQVIGRSPASVRGIPHKRSAPLRDAPRAYSRPPTLGGGGSDRPGCNTGVFRAQPSSGCPKRAGERHVLRTRFRRWNLRTHGVPDTGTLRLSAATRRLAEGDPDIAAECTADAGFGRQDRAGYGPHKVCRTDARRRIVVPA